MNNKEKISEVLDLIYNYGMSEGAHHKQWVIDQVVRILTGSDDKYKAWIIRWESEDGEGGESYYKWDKGIAP